MSDVPDDIYDIIGAGLIQDERIFQFYSSEEEAAVTGKTHTLILEHVQLNMVYFAFYFLILAERIVAMSDEEYAEYRRLVDINNRANENVREVYEQLSEIFPFFDETIDILTHNLFTRQDAKEILDGVHDMNDEISSQLHEHLETMDPIRKKNRITMAVHLLKKINWNRRRMAVMAHVLANPPNNNHNNHNNHNINKNVAAGGARRRPKRHTKRRSVKRQRYRRKHYSRKN